MRCTRLPAPGISFRSGGLLRHNGSAGTTGAERGAADSACGLNGPPLRQWFLKLLKSITLRGYKCNHITCPVGYLHKPRVTECVVLHCCWNIRSNILALKVINHQSGFWTVNVSEQREDMVNYTGKICFLLHPFSSTSYSRGQ